MSGEGWDGGWVEVGLGTLTYSFLEPSSSVLPYSPGLGTKSPLQVAGSKEHPSKQMHICWVR